MIVARNLFINYHFIVSKIIKPRTMSTKPSSLNLIAKKLSISEQLLKKQMYDPNAKQISPQQLKVLGIINEVSINTEQKFELKKKSAVVTIMGHVDHGKTTLIDYLRNSNITEGQAGGITQKIGAFHIKCHSQKITFIDTPGHEAFTNMRKRGAMVTDLIILIISAVQGIKRQTIQILSLIQTYKIPTIIAINKIDLLQGNPEAVEKNLNQIGVPIELFGGNIPVIHISAKKGKNIQLLSGLIVEETQHLKAIQEGLAEAVALQVYQNNEGLNCLIMIIKKGILKRGSILLIGDRFMKLKNMYDDCSNLLNIAFPGDAVVIIGIPNIPNAGDLLYEIENENKARFIIQKKQLTHRQQNNSLKIHGDNSDIKTKIKLNTRRKKKTFYRGLSSFMMEVYKQKQDIIVEKIQNLKNKQQTEEVIMQLKVRDEQLRAHKQYIYEYLLNSKNKKDLMNIIFKFVDRGIQETILQQISTLKKKIKQKYDIQINMMSSDIGNIDKKDIYQAGLFNAEIFGFGVQFHEDFQVDNQLAPIKPKLHQLIHEFLKDLQNTALEKKKKCLSGIEQGRCDIVEVYLLKMGKKKTNIYAAGVRVSTGKINIKNKIYIFRNNLPISQGFQVESINVFKKSVSEVIKGTECTIILRNKQESLFERGDQFVSYE